MTEAEWQACTAPKRMLAHLRDHASDRKMRLVAVACCRRVWPWLTDDRSRNAIAMLERFVDGAASRSELESAAREANDRSVTGRSTSDAYDDRHEIPAAVAVAEAVRAFSHLKWYHNATDDTILASEYATIATAQNPAESAANRKSADREADDFLQAREETEQVKLIRCVFGNPFRPVQLNPRWRTTDVVALARAIYDDRAFNRLPILADALMDAGCEDESIIGHSREHSPHVRGCWVVDLVLGKE